MKVPTYWETFTTYVSALFSIVPSVLHHIHICDQTLFRDLAIRHKDYDHMSWNAFYLDETTIQITAAS